MATAIQTNFRVRQSFGKIDRIIDIPNLIDIQMKSYDKFLQSTIEPGERDDIGLQGVFRSVFPIRDFNGTSELVFVGYTLERPKYDVDECRQRGAGETEMKLVFERFQRFALGRDHQQQRGVVVLGCAAAPDPECHRAATVAVRQRQVVDQRGCDRTGWRPVEISPGAGGRARECLPPGIPQLVELLVTAGGVLGPVCIVGYRRAGAGGDDAGQRPAARFQGCVETRVEFAVDGEIQGHEQRAQGQAAADHDGDDELPCERGSPPARRRCFVISHRMQPRIRSRGAFRSGRGCRPARACCAGC